MNRRKHFVLSDFTVTEPFAQPGRKFQKKVIPQRDRHTHGTELLGQIDAVKLNMEAARNAQINAGMEGGFGLQVEFESFPDVELAFESLARERSGIELLNVRQKEHLTHATVFVPDGKLAHFEKLVREYLEERRDCSGHLRDHKNLINTIGQIHKASLLALWTDDLAVFPQSENEVFWWEVWLPVRGDRSAVVNIFRKLAEVQGFQVAPSELAFPERTVLLVHTSAAAMSQSIMTLNSIAELRRAKETADFFDALPPEEQPMWMDELLDRCRFTQTEEDVPYICLLDTGVNNGHPLLAPALAENDLHTIEPGWGKDDIDGHGTAMAGLALVGNLTDCLGSDGPVDVSCRLESVKLFTNGRGQHR